MNLIRCIIETEFLSHCTRQQYQEKEQQPNNLINLRHQIIFQRNVLSGAIEYSPDRKRFTYTVLCLMVPLPHAEKLTNAKSLAKSTIYCTTSLHFLNKILLYVASEAFVQISFPTTPNQIEGDIFLRGVFVCLWSVVRKWLHTKYTGFYCYFQFLIYFKNLSGREWKWRI